MLVTELSQSLTLFGLGMGTVFVLLLLLIVCITAVSWICRSVENSKEDAAVDSSVVDADNSVNIKVDGGEVKAPLSANVLKICADLGDLISKGETIMLLEAMKMETEIRASHSGVLSEVHVGVGDSVVQEQTLMTLEAATMKHNKSLSPASANGLADSFSSQDEQEDKSHPAEQPSRQLSAPLSANVIDVCVSSEQQVKAGDIVVRLEAMKMETEVRAECGGYIAIIHVKPGDSVNAGQPLLTLN